jgi:hypothetical protein
MTDRGRWAVGIAAILSALLYVAWSWAGGHVGFPLDDAWIHQTYARNLVEYGQWAFVPGRPSAGSTSPLWTLLLAVGYALDLPFRPWTYALGGLCLVGTALLAMRLADRLWSNPTDQSPVVGPRSGFGRWALGLLVALEWHLVWAAVSGMETMLFALLALALWSRAATHPCRRPLLTGLLGGALILTRPEGLIAVGLVVVGVILAERVQGRWFEAAIAGALVTAGAGLVVAPYAALNLHLSGTVWPNTFYAKQAEYAVHLAQPLAARLWRTGTAPLIGGQVLLLPGLVWSAWREARRSGRSLRNWRVGWWLPLAWAATTTMVYALRLPVTYQHGRYLIPLIPIILVYGFGNLHKCFKAPRKALGLEFLVQVWALSAAILFLAFWFLGARAYTTDVAIIEEEMVTVAHWLDAHSTPNALVAVHDIGAVGYFAHRPLLDLAGLVNPEVVPFIRDEETLLAWLQEQDADYLVTFPSWYPALTADPQLEEVYRTDAAVTVGQGGENMAVYALHWDR